MKKNVSEAETQLPQTREALVEFFEAQREKLLAHARTQNDQEAVAWLEQVSPREMLQKGDIAQQQVQQEHTLTMSDMPLEVRQEYEAYLDEEAAKRHEARRENNQQNLDNSQEPKQQSNTQQKRQQRQLSR